MTSPVEVALYGTPQLRLPDGKTHTLERRDAAILAYLAFEGATTRNRLVELLWPDSEPEAARNTLRQRLFQLKKRAGREVVSGAESLAPAPDIVMRAIDENRDASLLDGHDFADCPMFDEWLQKQRNRLSNRRRESLVALADDAENSGRLAEALVLAEELVASEPLREDSHRRLMRVHYLLGDRAAALTAFDRCEGVLKDELSAKPAVETLALLASIERSTTIAGAKKAFTLPVSILKPPRLIGRERELALLRDAVEQKNPFFVNGEAGFGKSRLLADLARAARVMLIQCRPGDEEVPYSSLTRVVRALRSEVQDTATVQEQRLVAALLPELRETASMAAAIELPQLRHLLVSMLKRLAANNWRAFVIDDLHFADDASVEVFGAVLDSDVVGAMSIGFTQRPSESSEISRKIKATLAASCSLVEVDLKPFTQAQVEELVDSLGIAELHTLSVAPALTRHTGGSPLFALETLKALLLERHERASGDGRLPLPTTVMGLFERRLRRLSVAALSLARVAAIAGSDFSAPLAVAVLQSRVVDLADPWSELENSYVLIGEQFAHDLILEAVIRGIPFPVAKQLHCSIAQYLQQHRSPAASVAQHWYKAKEFANALPYFVAAAKKVQDKSQPGASVAMWALAAQCAREAASVDAEFEALTSLSTYLNTVKDEERQRQTVDRLTQLACDDRKRARLRIALSESHGARDDNVEGLKHALAGVPLARQAGDQESEARLLAHIVALASQIGRSDLIDAHLPALKTLLTRLENKSRIAHIEGAIALALDNMDRHDEGVAHHAAAIEITRELQDATVLATQLTNASTSARERGQFESALEYLREAEDVLSTQDLNPHGSAYTQLALGNVLRDLGRFSEALESLDKACASCGSVASPVLSLIHDALAVTYLHLGQYGRAIHHSDAAQQGPLGYAWQSARALWIRALIEQQLSKPVVELLEKALTTAPTDLRRRLVWRIELSLAKEIDVDEGYARALVTRRQISNNGSVPFRLLAEAVLADIALRRQAADLAAEHARSAVVLLDQCDAPFAYRPELQLCAFRCLRTAEPQLAGRVLRSAREWVDQALGTAPAEFKDSFLNRNRTNRDIINYSASEVAMLR